MTADLQRRIDAMAYPPTHTYRLSPSAPPTPTGILSERWALIRPLIVGSVRSAGTHFLDIGCSKGFFSLRLSTAGWRVTAIDTDPAAVALCRDLGINAKQTGFREWAPPEHKFGLVFMGNVNHYCYQEAGWAWVRKLAAVTEGGGTVVIEGPLGMDCADMATMKPPLSDAQRADFSRARFFEEMNRAGFYATHEGPTVAYTPNRYITAWTLEGKPQRRLATANTLQGTVLAVNPAKGSHVCRVAGLGDAVIKLHRDPPATLARSVAFAGVAPASTLVLCEIRAEDGRLHGWTEQYVVDDKAFDPGWKRRPTTPPMITDERAAFRAACLRNAELARMGMVDVDMGPANWRHVHGAWLTVDKDSIWPIATLEDAETDPETGRFVRTLEWASNPDAVPVALRRALAVALMTRSSVVVERAFLAAAEGLR